MNIIVPILNLITITILVHTAIFMAANSWVTENINIMKVDYDAYERRAASPPWYARYTNLVLRLPKPDRKTPKQ